MSAVTAETRPVDDDVQLYVSISALSHSSITGLCLTQHLAYNSTAGVILAGGTRGTHTPTLDSGVLSPTFKRYKRPSF